MITLPKKYKNNSFAFIRTRKNKPFGYIGYMLTIYDKKDDLTPILDIRAKTIKGINKPLSKLEELKGRDC
jgi:hypothetical protein